jgi:hypothetical protein
MNEAKIVSDAKIDRLACRDKRDIDCNLRRIGRHGHRALLPAAPSWIHIFGQAGGSITPTF